MAAIEIKRERLEELDILRAFALLGVIFIHILGASFQFVGRWSLTWEIYVFCDQFLRFAVPVFVFLSGFTLGLKYFHKSFRLIEFFKKRVWRILPWYFFWSAAIYVYTHFVVTEHGQQFPLWKLIFLGKADYHLYFVSMIFQLYLLFPLILFLIHKFKRKFIVFVFLFQASLYFASSLLAVGAFKINLLWGDQQQYLFFGTWIFYFILGIVFAQSKYEEKATRDLKKMAVVLLVGGLLFSVFDCLRVVARTGDLIIAARSSRIPVLFYVVGWLIASFVWAKELLRMPDALCKLLVYLGKKSYIIYLLHTLIIRIVALYILPSNFLNLLIFSALILVFSIILAEITDSAGRFAFAKVTKASFFVKI